MRHHFGDPGGTITAALRSGGLGAGALHRPATPSIAAPTAPSRASRRCASAATRICSGSRPTPSSQKATDFGRDHPQFKPSVITDAALGKVERLELGGPVPVKESSGLVFNHLCHLGPEDDAARDRRRATADRRCYSPDGLLRGAVLPRAGGRCRRTPDGVVRYRLDGVLEVDFPDPKQPLRAKLTCASCHQPDAGGANMRPVSMESHCSYCHSLSFDKENPDRVLPHGKPEEVVDVLTYFYGAEAVRPPLLRTDKTKQRRRPGAKAEPAAAPAPAPAQGAAPAQPNAAFAKRLERVFANDGESTCGYCHQTTASSTDKGGRLRHPAGAGAGHLGAPGALLPRAACQPALRALPRGGQIVAQLGRAAAADRRLPRVPPGRGGRRRSAVDLHHVPRLPPEAGHLPDGAGGRGRSDRRRRRLPDRRDHGGS